MFLKRHEAVDNAVDLFSLDFLFPKAHPEPKPAQLDVVLVDNKLQLDGKEVPWFNNRLNVEQMQAVQKLFILIREKMYILKCYYL